MLRPLRLLRNRSIIPFASKILPARHLILHRVLPRPTTTRSHLNSSPPLPRTITSSHTPEMDHELTSPINFYCNRPMQDWFIPSPSFDTALRTYEPLISRARSGSLDHLASTPSGCIALIILLDQIPRNIYRGSAAAFASDDKAYHIAVRGIAQGFDAKVGEESRQKQTLFYLPLEHREDLGAQVAARALFQAGVGMCEVGSEGRGIMEAGVKVSERHLVCVREHGRFPGRNEALGRESTREEVEFLREHPQGF